MMRHLHHFSIALTVSGVVIATIAVTAELNAAIALTGIMLAWAGVVKILVVHLWTQVAGLGSDRHDPIPPA